MRFLVRRTGRLLVVVLLVTAFTALLVNLVPGDPVTVIAPNSTAEQRAELRDDLGLDESLPARYVDWLGDAVRGDFGNYYGTSASSGRSVSGTLGDALPVSLLLILYAQVLALLVAVPLGVLTAYRAGGWADRMAATTTFGLMAVPNFALGLILAYYLGVRLQLVPPGGYTSFREDVFEHARTMLLPALTLAVGQIAIYFRLLRSDLIATLKEDFVLFAKAQGYPARRVLWRHALRPSSLTLLTVVGINMGALIGGALTMEVVFSLPGIGLVIFQAIQERQYIALQGAVAVVAAVYVLANFAVDVLHQWLDPRTRHAADA